MAFKSLIVKCSTLRSCAWELNEPENTATNNSLDKASVVENSLEKCYFV